MFRPLRFSLRCTPERLPPWGLGFCTGSVRVRSARLLLFTFAFSQAFTNTQAEFCAGSLCASALLSHSLCFLAVQTLSFALCHSLLPALASLSLSLSSASHTHPTFTLTLTLSHSALPTLTVTLTSLSLPPLLHSLASDPLNSKHHHHHSHCLCLCPHCSASPLALTVCCTVCCSCSFLQSSYGEGPVRVNLNLVTCTPTTLLCSFSALQQFVRLLQDNEVSGELWGKAGIEW